MDITTTIDQLERRKQQLQSDLGNIDRALIALRGLGRPRGSGKRSMSAEGRAAIIAAQKKRWAKAKVRGLKGSQQMANGPRKRRTMSPEAREKIAAAQRARWAKVRANK